MATQNTGLLKPASNAPGMAAMTALSTTSIVAIDSVSAARTTPSAPKKPSPPLMSGSVETTTLTAWDEMLNVNLRAVFHLMQLAAPHLEERRGNIVNVSSVTGLRAFPGVLAYCVSKAGVDQLTRCAALELAAKGVRVNAVNPGVVKTEVHLRGGMNEEAYAAFLEHSKGTHPLGRIGDAREVAELILFLASDRAAWITGATYSIDGGRAQTCAR